MRTHRCSESCCIECPRQPPCIRTHACKSPPERPVTTALADRTYVAATTPRPAPNIHRLVASYTRNCAAEVQGCEKARWLTWTWRSALLRRTCAPRLGATLRQLAPLPLNNPRQPSCRHAFRSSSPRDAAASPRHIITYCQK